MVSPSSSATEANLSAQSTKGEHGQVPETGEHALTTAAAEGHGAPHADPAALGLDATAWVALAMLVVIAIMLWKRVPGAIGAALDRRIGVIRQQLDEAARLRAEAEALRAEYEARAAAARGEAETMIARAKAEGEAIVAKAEADSAALIERRTKMAEEKIAAEERAAIQQVRNEMVAAAAAAAARLIAEERDAVADKALVDATISELGRS